MKGEKTKLTREVRRRGKVDDTFFTAFYREAVLLER